MMNRYVITTLWILLFFLLTGFTSDPNAKANALYVNAFKLMKSAKTERGNYTKVFERYQSARAKIDTIIADYAASDIAVRLVSEQTNIAGFTLDEFERLRSDLLPLAKAEQEPLACALYVAGAIDAAYPKAKALAEIAGRYVETGQQVESSLQLLAQASGLTPTISGPYDKADALATIAETYAVVGDLAKALESVRKIESQSPEHKAVDHYKTRALAGITAMFEEAAQLEQIRKTAESLEEGLSYRGETLGIIAGRYAETSQFTEAKEIADSIMDSIYQNKALLNIAVAHSQAGQFNTVIEAANNISLYLEDDKAWLLADISGKYVKAGQYEEANQLLSLAVDAAATLKDSSYQSIVFAFIADKYAEVGQQEKAAQLFTQALKLAKTIDYAGEKARVLAKIASIHAGANRQNKAALLLVLSQALESVKTAEDADFKDETLVSIAGAYARMGRFLEAIKVAAAIEDADDKDQALAGIADQYAGAGQFAKAFEMVTTIRRNGNKARVLANIAGRYALSGQQPGKREMEILQSIVQTTKPMKLPWVR